jgi:uncharacterized membrane protein YhaH (DUF805 family)
MLNNPYAAPDAEMSDFDNDGETYQPKIFALEGRIGRLRYIGYSWFLLTLCTIVILLIASVLLPGMMRTGRLMSSFVFYIPTFAVSFVIARRRLHDLDRSG